MGIKRTGGTKEIKIGLTGGIGSGKSTVTDYLLEKGYPVVDADKIAGEITLPGSPVLEELVKAFGGDILDEKGRLKRKLLAERAFGNEEGKKKLDHITHGEIGRRIGKALEDNKEPVIFVDAPLLFEAGLAHQVDRVWTVSADEDLRIHRVSRRDGVSSHHVMARIKSQMDEEEKKSRADVVIHNGGTKKELYEEIEKLLKGVKKEIGEKE